MTVIASFLACSSSDGEKAIADAGTTADANSEIDTGLQAPDSAPPATDGGSTASDGGCPYAYCEDFERYPVAAIRDGEIFGPWIAHVSGPPGGLQGVDAVNAKSGKQSLHITAPATTQGAAMLSQTNGFGLTPSNNVFGRVEIFYTEGGTFTGPDGGTFGLPFNVHSFVFTASGYNGDGGTEGVNLQFGTARTGQTPTVALNFTDPIGISGGAVTGGAWHCLQWQLDGSGTTPANVATLWLDGTQVATGGPEKGWTFPEPWIEFNLGFTHLQTLGNPVEIFIDDFALDGAMIPCL